LAAQQGRSPLHCTPEVSELLERYDWPGNVRELFNCARYLSGLTAGDLAQISDLPQRIRAAAGAESPKSTNAPQTNSDNPTLNTHQGPAVRYDLSYKKAKRLWLEVFEYAYINRLLEKHDGNISHAARAAGIDRKSIQRLMKRNEMSLPQQKEEDDSPETQE
jgi:DNA-binding NtrC family response regulator